MQIASLFFGGAGTFHHPPPPTCPTPLLCAHRNFSATSGRDCTANISILAELAFRHSGSWMGAIKKLTWVRLKVRFFCRHDISSPIFFGKSQKTMLIAKIQLVRILRNTEHLLGTWRHESSRAKSGRRSVSCPKFDEWTNPPKMQFLLNPYIFQASLEKKHTHTHTSTRHDTLSANMQLYVSSLIWGTNSFSNKKTKEGQPQHCFITMSHENEQVHTVDQTVHHQGYQSFFVGSILWTLLLPPASWTWSQNNETCMLECLHLNWRRENEGLKHEKGTNQNQIQVLLLLRRSTHTHTRPGGRVYFLQWRDSCRVVLS